MKTIAVLLLLTGLLLFAAGTAVFFFTDCRKVFQDLRTTRKFGARSEIDTAAQEAYYNNLLAYNNDAPPVKLPAKKRFQMNIPRRAADDTALLAGNISRKDPQKPPAFEESRGIPLESGGTKPLTILQDVRSPGPDDATEPLRAAGTEPLEAASGNNDLTEALQSRTAPL